MKRLVWTVALVFVVSSWASADAITVDLFSAAGALHTSIFDQMHNSNTGGEGGDKVGPPGSSNPYSALYYFDLSAVPGLMGGTVNSATFTVNENWGGTAVPNVELRRMDCPIMWEQGDGYWDAPDWRFSNDNGCGDYMVDWFADNTTSSGHDWAGNSWSWLSSSAVRFPTAVKDLIDNQMVNTGGTSVFTMTSLVQNWADGTWANKGFTLYTGNLPSGSPGMASLNGAEVDIDYDPIPEPATMLLIGTGVLATLGWVRRRRMK